MLVTPIELDPETEKNIIGSIQSLQGEKALVIISYRASAVWNCDRIYQVENERIERIFSKRFRNERI